jgi:putative membrane protein insertion efficiency factor
LTFYKTQISPILPRSCRYVPTCSDYSIQAYKRYGFFKGSTLTLYRICRCNPLGASGYDPPIWFGEIRPPPPPEEEQLDHDHNS